MTTPSHLLFLDCETTGTDPGHDALLEVGAILTRWAPDLPEVARASLVLRPAGSLADHDRLWAQMHPHVREMHTANGLWEESTTGPDAWSLLDADDAIATWIDTHAGAEPLPLAGSGIGHLDRPFVLAQLPRVATHLTYWHVDIGNVRRMLDLAGRSDHVDLATDVDSKPHRALGDCDLHVREARRYLTILGQLPALSTA